MDPRKPMTGMGVIILVLAVFGAAVLAGAGVWYWQYRANARLTDDLAAAQARIAELEARIVELESSQTTGTGGAAGPGTGGADADTSEEDPGVPAAATSAREFAYITDINEAAGGYTWVLDYAQWLTGDAAAAAAAAHGDDSPPPNDYYVVNDNPRLRTFPVAPAAKVTVYFGDPTSKAVLGLGEYYDVWLNDTDGNGRNTHFWVTIENGTVTGAEEQWVP